MTEECVAFVKGLLHVYLEQRDLERFSAGVDRAATWFGPAGDEGKEALGEGFGLLGAQEWKMGGPLHIAREKYGAQELGEGACVVTGELELLEQGRQLALAALELRVSAVCRRQGGGGLKIAHLHCSMPQRERAAGGYVPRRLAENYNEVLEKALRERTQELYKKNLELETLAENVPGGVFNSRLDENFTLEYINDGYLRLAGYTREQLKAELRNRAIGMVDVRDREAVRASIWAQLEKGDVAEVEHRLRRRDGQTVWVTLRGRRILDQTGEPLFCCVLIDCTEARQAQEAMRVSEERYRIVCEQSDDIIFEYNIQDGTMFQTALFQKKFGYAIGTSNFPGSVTETGVVHPDDVRGFLCAYERLFSGQGYTEQELRIRKADGSYLWCELHVSLIRGADGLPLRAVGKIIDVDREKKEREHWIAKAQRDALTGLYNKETTRLLIEARMEKTAGRELDALYIMDVDDFKSVNDRLGHMYGDAVLSEIADKLRRIFRGTDIVGRIGGDEFLVYLKNVQREEYARQKACELTQVFHHMFVGEGMKISGSVGVALFPGDATSYMELFQKADNALYWAKSHGKDSFAMAGAPEDAAREAQAAQTLGEALGSRRVAREERPFGEGLLEYIFRVFYQTGDIGKAVNLILGLTGRYFGVSRAYVFEDSEDGLACSNTFEWCNEGVPSQKEKLQNLPYGALEGFRAMFNEEGIFYCQNLEGLPPALQKVLGAQGIVSIILVAILDDGVMKGYVGFDECQKKLYPTRKVIDSLQLIAQIISTFLLKKHAQDRLARALFMAQAVMDNIDLWLYVIDPASYRLLFLNRKTERLVPGARVGDLCYRALQGRQAPCERCPMQRLGGGGHKFTQRMQNSFLGILTDITASRIQWTDGATACLVCCSCVEEEAPARAIRPAGNPAG